MKANQVSFWALCAVLMGLWSSLAAANTNPTEDASDKESQQAEAQRQKSVDLFRMRDQSHLSDRFEKRYSMNLSIGLSGVLLDPPGNEKGFGSQQSAPTFGLGFDAEVVPGQFMMGGYLEVTQFQRDYIPQVMLIQAGTTMKAMLNRYMYVGGRFGINVYDQNRETKLSVGIGPSLGVVMPLSSSLELDAEGNTTLTNIADQSFGLGQVMLRTRWLF